MSGYSSRNMRKGFYNRKLWKRIINNQRRYDEIREFLAHPDNWHDVYWDIKNDQETYNEVFKDVPLMDTLRMGPRFWEAVGEKQRRANWVKGNDQVEKARYPWQEMDKIKKMKTLAERRQHRFEKIYNNTKELQYDNFWQHDIKNISEWARFRKAQEKHNLRMKSIVK